MLSKLESFIKNKLKEPLSTPDEIEKQIMIATAVLFLEMAYADFEIVMEEEKRLIKILHKLFQLNPDEIDELIEAAKESRDKRNDIWKFTNLLKSQFDHEQKIGIMENMWRLIFADGHVDRYEDALIRKLTTLLGLEHGDMIQAKIKVKNSLDNL